ncbi:MAG: peptidoglycan bridge formation glycyltransferase FemA/FemB family protein [Bacteroidetes bacterium]|nr:peptidoglycan bridge formation glycyltransferase FemA/FemB family protein [Bacteroidota bacterium]
MAILTKNTHHRLQKSTLNRGPFNIYLGFRNSTIIIIKKKILLVRDNNYNAWIPIAIESKLFIREAQFLNAPSKNGVELNSNQQLDFFNKLILVLKAQKIAHRIIQPHPAGIISAVPEKAKWIPFGTYITHLNLFASDEELLNSYDTKYKKAIQHSINNGGVVKFGEEVYNDFYNLYCQTTKRANIHQDTENYFDECRKHLGSEHTLTAVVYDGEQPLGGIFINYSKNTSLCTHAGSGGNSKLYGAMKLLHYESMKKLRDSGVQNYDLVGVRIGSSNEALEGVFRFKKGFGGYLKEGYLWKMDLETTSIKIYEFFQKLKNKDSKADIIDQELMAG